MEKKPFDSKQAVGLCQSLAMCSTIVLALVVLLCTSLFLEPQLVQWVSHDEKNPVSVALSKTASAFWKAPDESTIPNGPAGDEIRYGKDLIAHTSKYLGPKGLVKPISNGMNCQNCHLDAGTRIYGNNYSAVASTYPKFRGRSGTEESIEKRVNDCLERSLNGKPLEEDSREMKAMVAYIRWVGSKVAKGVSPEGVGLVELEFLDRPADPLKGKVLFESKCVICHGKNGEGMINEDGRGWLNPPLWGENSYNYGAGLFRLSRFAGYIKANMPMGTATFDKPELTDEEAWDIAAYVNSQPRPAKDLSADWPDISKKPIDHPFGPYVDDFSEQQHKYGPFKPILEKQKLLRERVAKN